MFPTMTRAQWDETARRFADHMGQFRALVERGVAPIRFLEEESMEDPTDCPIMVGVFGSDCRQACESQRELELLRERLHETEAREMGFGVSGDGQTWALLVGIEKSSYRTTAGQTTQRELLKCFFEEALRAIWLQVECEAAEHAVRAAALSHGT